MGQVYRHVSPSGKSYVGMTRYTWEKRAGKDPLGSYATSLRFLQALKKYGWESFQHEVLETLNEVPALYQREAYWIDYFDCVGNGYNRANPFRDQEVDSIALLEVAKLESQRKRIENLYYEKRFSLNEIATLLGTEFYSLRLLFRQNDLEVFGNTFAGLRAREIASRPQTKICERCSASFPFSRRKFCSDSCRSSFRRTLLAEAPAKNKAIARGMSGNSNAAGNIGGLVTSHKRWHTNRGVTNPDCVLCAG